MLKELEGSFLAMLKTEVIPQLERNAAGSTANMPCYLCCAALAVPSVMIGGRWDVSWHESIGRDSFWTPSHMAIYLCGVLAGVVCGYLILNTTFRKSSEIAASSVRVMGFTG